MDDSFADVVRTKGNIVSRIPENIIVVELATQGVATGTVVCHSSPHCTNKFNYHGQSVHSCHPSRSSFAEAAQP